MIRFDQEINTLKKMSNVTDDLTRAEIVKSFKEKLEHAVVKGLDTAFAQKIFSGIGITSHIIISRPS